MLRGLCTDLVDLGGGLLYGLIGITLLQVESKTFSETLELRNLLSIPGLGGTPKFGNGTLG